MSIPQSWTFGIAFVCLLVYYWWRGQGLSHIPTVGPSSPFLSFIGAIEFLYNAPGVVQRGADQYGHAIFKIPNLDRWTVIVTGTKYIEELRKAPEEILSFVDAESELLQTPYTLGPTIEENQYHVPIIRSALTRNLAAIFPSLHNEVISAFDDVLGGKLRNHEWSNFRPMDILMPVVCRTSGRALVGFPLCRNADFSEINAQFTVTVIKAASILYLLPEFLKPVAAYFITSVSSTIDRTADHLKPVVEERRRRMKELGTEYPGKPNDMLSWLIDKAEGEETSVRNLALRILAIYLAAIHTMTLSFTHVVYYLAANPKYVPALRDEITAAVHEAGWSHSTLNRLVKVDSFIKETQRLNAIGCLLMPRVARQPFTFSDGTYIPKGTHIEVAALATHLDNSNYPNPTAFQPFRFVNLTNSQNKGRKLDMASTHADFVAFGHGVHACPGRFFAADVLKLMLVHIVLNYDVKLVGDHPKNMWILRSCIPSRTAEVQFRKRVS